MLPSSETLIRTSQNPEFHRRPSVTIKDLPTHTFPPDRVTAILALGRKSIDPFETLKTFEAYQEEPLPQEHLTKLMERLAVDSMGLRKTKKGLRIHANSYCRFLLAVTETIPEGWQKP